MIDKITLIVVLLWVCTSCGHSTGEVVRLIEERDSLKTLTARQERYIDQVDQMMTLVNSGLDSISSEEQLIFPAIKEAGTTKDQVLTKIDGVARLIGNQKARIADLERQIKESSDNSDEKENSQLEQMIERYKEQLAKKDQEIRNLKEELSRKDVDLANMKTKIDEYSSTIAELGRKNSIQEKALQQQDKILNQCYMVIGTKDELTKAGIVKKGKVVAQGALDRSKFSKVDIRKFSEMEFVAKRPRVLTQMPENSYYIVTNGKNNYTLKITNTSDFWKVSNYLIIQTD